MTILPRGDFSFIIHIHPCVHERQRHEEQEQIYERDTDKERRQEKRNQPPRISQICFPPTLFFSPPFTPPPPHPFSLLFKSFKTPELQPHNRPLMVTTPQPPSFQSIEPQAVQHRVESETPTIIQIGRQTPPTRVTATSWQRDMERSGM